MNQDLADEEFVGYTFNASPERRPRLWFLDRHIGLLINRTVRGIDVGGWSFDSPGTCVLVNDHPVPGLLLRYEHHGAEPWTAVWRLTDTTIPNVNTFGYDDTWRLGVWPD